MKIGILIKDFYKLKNWELRIIHEIIRDPTLTLSVLIQDGREEPEHDKSLKYKIIKLFRGNNVLGKILLKVQEFIEGKFFFKPSNTIDRNAVIQSLKEIDTLQVKPIKKGFIDEFGKKDAEEIIKYDLDIILRHGFTIIRGEILNSSKYGIWSFHHGDNSINRGSPVGFWEISLKQPAIGVTLQQLTPELDGGLIIDKAFFNRHWSLVKTKNFVFEASVSLLFKNIKKLQRGQYSPSKSLVYYNPLYKSPNLFFTTRYIGSFYYNLIKNLYRKLNLKFFGTRYNCWSLFIGKGNFLNSTLFRLKPIVPPKNEFWADPFIYEYKDDTYIFFENYNYKTKIGKISCGKINGHTLIDIQDVLDLPYHLSFPNIFEENGEIYLMPETSANKRLEIYRCVDFPVKWELYSTAFDGEAVADSFFYDDEQNQKWLFLNKKASPNTPMENELFIYRVDSVKLERIEPHHNNPVLIDTRSARNAGSIFKYEKDIYRPSQANIDGLYGNSLNINKIKVLSIDEYDEETIVVVKPNFHKDLVSMHHLHQSKNLFVIDAAFKKI